MSGRYATEQAFFDDRQRLVCGCKGTCVGHSDTAPTLPENPRKLSRKLVSILISADRCAKCLGELDTGLKCNECGYDWMPWFNASVEINNAAFDRREA